MLLADGTVRPIGDIQPGDEVVATDPETGETSNEPVTRLHVNIDRELTNLTVRDGGVERAVTLETTAHHPFWDATDRRWVDVGKLQVGHRLLVHDDKRLEGDGTGAGAGGGGPGREVTVVAVDNFTGSEVMHDLTVATHHTYYALAGPSAVLVLNCGGKIHQDKYSGGGSTRCGGLDANHRPASVSAPLNGDDFYIGRGHLLGWVWFPNESRILSPSRRIR
ncbi:polymorphic toxin-type HINT domain-containing protein [Micromonospora echinospora]|uniref:polymorphic toxin-type HINT domain-containing protein n=1 Tax=Micromonospora echinospora TaxID=1877 RepID=UPI003A85BF76